MSSEDSQGSDSSGDMSELTSVSMTRNIKGEIRQKRHDGRYLKVSVCDIVDNSIDGGASEIDILYIQSEYCGKESMALIISDDGKGIPADRMQTALEFNSKRYEDDQYEPWMSGSFGVGLKDACLAHGREITVFSRSYGEEEFPYGDFPNLTIFGIKKIIKWASQIGGFYSLSEENMYPEWKTDAFEMGINCRREGKGTVVPLEDMDVPEDETEVTHPEDEVADFVSMVFCDYLIGIDLGPRTKDEPRL